MFLKVERGGRSWAGFLEIPRTPPAMEKIFDSLQGSELKAFRNICAALPCPKEYLLQNIDEYGWNDVMIGRASLFIPVELPRPIPYFPRYWRCFENSFAYAKKHGLKYIEGLAVNPTGIQVHAWMSRDGTDVLDYTWPYQHLNRYFGIEFDTEELAENGFPNGGLLGHYHKELQEKRARSAT